MFALLPMCGRGGGAPAAPLKGRRIPLSGLTGTVYRHDYYGSIIFKKAVKDAGLPPGTTSHALRHHYASVLLHAGESVVAVAERLGHENAALVLSTYGHLMPNSEERTRAAVDAAWCAINVPSEVSATL